MDTQDTLIRSSRTQNNIDKPDRALWVQVGVPHEHGGWSLTLEPVVLGLLIAWSWPGFALGVVATLAFIARTPLKIVLVDMWRKRWLERTTFALVLVAVEVAVMCALFIVVMKTAQSTLFVVPLLIAVPLVLMELYFDMRSKSRRLVPELAGTLGISSVAAAIVVAGGGALSLGIGLWIILSARAVAAISYVRVQMFRTRNKEYVHWHSDLAQALAVAAVLIAWRLGLASLLAVSAIATIAIFNVVAIRGPLVKMKNVGVQQMLFGLAVINSTAISM
ncbi:MAG: YwiC-like family protein [Acidimicrobiia bacterium]